MFTAMPDTFARHASAALKELFILEPYSFLNPEGLDSLTERLRRVPFNSDGSVKREHFAMVYALGQGGRFRDREVMFAQIVRTAALMDFQRICEYQLEKRLG